MELKKMIKIGLNIRKRDKIIKMEEQKMMEEMKEKIKKILDKLEQLKDTKENKEKIFELCYKLRLLTKENYKRFKEIWLNSNLLSTKNKNACNLISNNGKSNKYEKDWIKYREKMDKKNGN